MSTVQHRLMREENYTYATDVIVTEDVMEILHCSKRTLYRHRKNGTLRSIRPTGGRLFFFRSDVERLLHGGGQHSSQTPTTNQKVA